MVSHQSAAAYQIDAAPAGLTAQEEGETATTEKVHM